MLGLWAAASVAACRRSTDTQSSGSKTSGATSTQPASSPPAAAPLLQRRLGRTGVMVSVLGLGGFHIGQKLSEAESVALIRRAVDNGINFLDNCWDYNEGESELRMGKALADGYRQRVFLMTKIDGRTKKSAREQLEQSLERLKTDVIDLVQIHEIIRANDPERCFADDGTIEALIEARQAGKLKYIGFTGHKDPEIHLAMLNTAKRHGFTFDTVQMPLNVMDPHYKSFEKHVLPVLVAEDIGVLGMKSMGSGDILKSGLVTPEECLRYALSLPTSVVIAGMDSVEVLEANLKVARSFKPMSESEKRALLARTEPAAREGKHEAFKIGQKFDGTGKNPHWLEEARL
jgi:aryl-alcohol dehydrogenase-like predicted oxidoreductase